MPLVQLTRWILDVDADATRVAYRRIDRGSPEVCGCAHCRNFVAVRSTVYTANVLEALAPLGFEPPIREAEIFHTCRFDTGIHCYGGFLHVIGSIAEGDDAQRQLSPNLYTYDMVLLTPHFSVAVTKRCHLVPEPLRNRDLLQIEFAVEVPWVLDEAWD